MRLKVGQLILILPTTLAYGSCWKPSLIYLLEAPGGSAQTYQLSSPNRSCSSPGAMPTPLSILRLSSQILFLSPAASFPAIHCS